MSKYLIFTDIHIDHSLDRPTRLKSGLKMLKELLIQAAQNGYTVLFCGDLLDKAKPDIKVVNGILAVFQLVHSQHPDLQVYAISGNHDQSGKNSLSTPAATGAELWQSATMFSSEASNWQYLKGEKGTGWKAVIHTMNGKRHLIVGVDYLEYATELDAVLNDVANNIETFNYDKAFMLLHQTPNELDPRLEGHVSIAHPAFQHFDMVFNGHIHQYAVMAENFMLVGIPMETRANEAGTNCGYVLYDPTRNRVEHISTSGQYPSYTSNPDEAEPGYFRPEFEADETAPAAFKSYAKRTPPQETLQQYLNEVEADKDLVKAAMQMANTLWA